MGIMCLHMPIQSTSVLAKWKYIVILLPTISKYASIYKADVKTKTFNNISQHILLLHTNKDG